MANSTNEIAKPSSRVGSREGNSQSAYAFRFVEVGSLHKPATKMLVLLSAHMLCETSMRGETIGDAPAHYRKRLLQHPRKRWLALATQDAAIFHVALSHYTGNYSLVYQESDPVEALRFRMEAMRLVNQRPGHVERALPDDTLGTVASLSSYEAWATNGSLTAISTHMKGLQRLVTLRGGLQADMNPYTRRLFLWADLKGNGSSRNCPISAIILA
ncbi:hypothetical protein DL95DRAFT_465303 [Leptodontidium sp. 2 PMI_412]|nr:hypothetical protein DL95DRAFT_465303 [Leptodontidium sp. 2 PMI_412]